MSRDSRKSRGSHPALQKWTIGAKQLTLLMILFNFIPLPLQAASNPIQIADALQLTTRPWFPIIQMLLLYQSLPWFNWDEKLILWNNFIISGPLLHIWCRQPRYLCILCHIFRIIFFLSNYLHINCACSFLKTHKSQRKSWSLLKACLALFTHNQSLVFWSCQHTY